MFIQIKNLIDEDFVNYYKCSMFIGFPHCSFKCNKFNNKNVCQNYNLYNAPTITISTKAIVERYLNNPITQAVVIGGLEPFDDAPMLYKLVEELRRNTLDDIVIYTGYDKKEVENYLEVFSIFPNIIIKYGRYVEWATEKYDELLQVTLASGNQYAENLYCNKKEYIQWLIEQNNVGIILGELSTDDVELKDYIKQIKKANQNNIKITTNFKLFYKIADKLKNNNGYCPCSIIKNQDTICMCKQFQQQKEGVCHCQIFMK